MGDERPKTDWKAKAAQNAIENYVVEIRSILDGDLPEIDFLVPGCIPRGNIVLFSGESGSRKTWLAYELARAVATGTKWMNRGVCLGEGQPQTVLILNYDNPTATLRVRLMKLGFTGDMPIWVHTQGLTKSMLTLPTEASRLKMIIDYFNPALTIVDSLRQAQTMNENDNQEMGQLMSIFKTWTNTESKNTVLILHHTAKNGESGWAAKARGSGEIISSAGVVIELGVKDEKLTARWTKHQAWEIGDVKDFTFEVEDKFVDNDDMTKDADVVERTFVRATSELPGEKDITIDGHILNAMYEAKRPLTRAEIYVRASPVKKPIVDIAVRRLLGRQKLRSRTTKGILFYEVVPRSEGSD